MAFGGNPFLHFMQQALANPTATPTATPTVTPTADPNPTPVPTGTPDDYLGPAAQMRRTREQNLNNILALFQQGVDSSRVERAATSPLQPFQSGTGVFEPDFLESTRRFNPDLRYMAEHFPGLVLTELFGGGDGTDRVSQFWQHRNDGQIPRGQ
jgi:hypothetical protein